MLFFPEHHFFWHRHAQNDPVYPPKSWFMMRMEVFLWETPCCGQIEAKTLEKEQLTESIEVRIRGTTLLDLHESLPQIDLVNFSPLISMILHFWWFSTKTKNCLKFLISSGPHKGAERARGKSFSGSWELQNCWPCYESRILNIFILGVPNFIEPLIYAETNTLLLQILWRMVMCVSKVFAPRHCFPKYRYSTPAGAGTLTHSFHAENPHCKHDPFEQLHR